MEKTDNEVVITLEGFKLIRSFYPEFTRKHIRSNEFFIGWSELMPVWLKICKMHSEEFGLLTSTCSISNIGVSIKAKSSAAPQIAQLALHGTVSIQDVYQSIVEYIKWYNSQPK